MSPLDLVAAQHVTDRAGDLYSCWPMQLIAEYLERAAHFERMAADEDDPNLKAQLAKQAADYRKLAEKRAKQLGLPSPPAPGA